MPADRWRRTTALSIWRMAAETFRCGSPADLEREWRAMGYPTSARPRHHAEAEERSRLLKKFPRRMAAIARATRASIPTTENSGSPTRPVSPRRTRSRGVRRGVGTAPSAPRSAQPPRPISSAPSARATGAGAALCPAALRYRGDEPALADPRPRSFPANTPCSCSIKPDGIVSNRLRRAGDNHAHAVRRS